MRLGIDAALVVAITAALTFWSGRGAAQDPAARAEAPQPARELFDEATSAYHQHQYATAARLFRQVHGMMEGHPRQFLVLFNLGQCLMDAGEYDEATATFEQILRDGGDQVENRGEVQMKLARLRELTSPAPTNDDQAPAPAVAASGPDEGLLIASIAGFGTGVLGLATLTVFGTLALTEHQSLQNGCGATTSCRPEDISTGNTYALVADIGLAVGAVGVATGFVLLVMALTESSGETEQATASFQPWLGPNLVGGAETIRW